MKTETRCFACNRIIRQPPATCNADTRDGQTVIVGPECLRKIEAAGEDGWPVSDKPGYVRLYPMPACDCLNPPPAGWDGVSGVYHVSESCPVHNLHPVDYFD